MKKLFLLILIVFNVTLSHTQCAPPPPPEGDCGCGYLMAWDQENCEFDTDTPAYRACLDTEGCAAPIDSNIIILLSLALLLGLKYTVKKRRFEN
ncbi:hypothetical protein [Flavobacterium tegetincola]|uniref:hypothetical protein n=1 Tax=Flavobacterium tegetincola TaxID=150172 RepID=UPI00047B9088|nr:hypothetical protein [Flavobacterium tegetincola]